MPMVFLRKNKKLAIAFFVCVLFFSGFFLSKCFSQEIEVIELTTETWSGQKILDGDYVIGEYQMISIEKGTEVIFTEGSSLYLESGVIDAVGTVKEPIFFKSETGEAGSYHIFVDDSSGIYFRNVDISGGGTLKEGDPSLLSGLIKRVQAEQFHFGALNKTGNGSFIIDNCYFHNNEIAIRFFGDVNSVNVNRTRFFENDISVWAENNGIFLDFKYNWWENDNYQGSIDNSEAKDQKYFKDPVVLIPGIMGSVERDGECELNHPKSKFNPIR